MKTYQVTSPKGETINIPAIGYGTAAIGEFMEDSDHVYATVLKALELGYRHFDTASIYGNERSIGRAIAASGLPRSELFIVSKAWPTQFGKAEVKTALRESLDRLQLDYLDLYLLHWPYPQKSEETWAGLTESINEGTTKLIGASNYRQSDLDELKTYSDIKPATNQIELHPYLGQQELAKYCQDSGILVSAWSPLGTGSWSGVEEQRKPIHDPVVKQIAADQGISAAQVLVQWNLNRGNIVLVKSETEANMKSNLLSDQVSLSAEDIAKIDALDQQERLGADPSVALPDFLNMTVPS